MRKTVFYFSILSIGFFTACKKDLTSDVLSDLSQAPSGNSSGQEIAAAFEPNELLVKFKKGASQTGRVNAMARITGNVKEKILTKAMQRFGDDEGVFLLRTPLAVLEAVEKMKGGAEIEYAEPNWIYTHSAVSNDTYYTNNSLWGMYGDASSPANQFGSQAAEAWAAGHTGSAFVYVGIIDEGIQFDHPDLAGQIWTNPDDPANGQDDDRNGYVDDIHGWDFDGNNNTIYDGGKRGSLDDHGTHVAGTIGAKKNEAGVVGVNWSAFQIVAVKRPPLKLLSLAQ